VLLSVGVGDSTSTFKIAGGDDDGAELREETGVDSCELFSPVEVRVMSAAALGLGVDSVRVTVVVTVTVVADVDA